MHNRLYENQSRLHMKDLRGHAEALGLDVEHTETELKERAHEGRIRDDFLGPL
jgi:hypothetical protein